MTNLMFSCDVPPHDEENCSTNEAELNGAGEKEWCTILNELEKMMEVRQISHTDVRYKYCGFATCKNKRTVQSNTL